MAFTIETNVALPPRTRGTGVMATVRTLKVGDSFIAPKKMQNGITGFSRTAGITLTTRTISDTEIRVWRTA